MIMNRVPFLTTSIAPLVLIAGVLFGAGEMRRQEERIESLQQEELQNLHEFSKMPAMSEEQASVLEFKNDWRTLALEKSQPEIENYPSIPDSEFFQVFPDILRSFNLSLDSSSYGFDQRDEAERLLDALCDIKGLVPGFDLSTIRPNVLGLLSQAAEKAYKDGEPVSGTKNYAQYLLRYANSKLTN